LKPHCIQKATRGLLNSAAKKDEISAENTKGAKKICHQNFGRFFKKGRKFRLSGRKSFLEVGNTAVAIARC
jgi:hypothetical protein